MLSDIEQYLRRFVVLPADEQYLVASLYVIHTWTFKLQRATPYLYIHSPTKGSGKTRFLEVMESIVRNPIRTNNITPSALFNLIEALEPTLLVDEVDAIWSGRKNEELRSVLNSGYRTGSQIWRMRRGEPTPYNTYCPKLLAGIYNMQLPDTIRDRALPIVMRKRNEDDPILEPFWPDEIKDEAAALVEKITLWVLQNEDELTYDRPKPIADIDDRAWEISEPLVSIAALLDKEKDARKAVTFLIKSVEGQKSNDVSLMQEIIEAFNGQDKIFTEELLEFLQGRWTAKRLAAQLRIAGIEPRVVRKGNMVRRGYDRTDFASALGEWDRNN